MSENITILEGGRAENFGQVTKLRTDNGDGGHDLWVPESDVATRHLSVKKNGLYYTNQYTPTSAEKKGKDSHSYDVYGFDTITVSVKKKVKGKKKKGGIDVPTIAEIDDDGNIVESDLLPVRIEIETLPQQIIYYNGETIHLDGIAVKAYDEDDEEWGTVPFEELYPKPTKAQGGSSGGQKFDGFEFTQDLSGAGKYTKRTETLFTVQEGVTQVLTAGKLIFVGEGLSKTARITFDGEYYYGGGMRDSGFTDAFWCLSPSTGEVTLGYLYDGVRLQVGFAGAFDIGEETEQTIKVNWNRGDDTILTDSFNITVIPSN